MVDFFELVQFCTNQCLTVSSFFIGINIMKFFNKNKKYFAAPLVLTGSGSAFATAVDYTSLTTAIDFSTTTSAVLTVAAALVLVYIAWKGAKIILGAVKGG